MLSRHVSIIDIGSNSIRLVIYEEASIVPSVIYNEKVKVGLGKNLHINNYIEKDLIEKAYQVIKRFTVIIKTMKCKFIYTVATAAIRNSKNSNAILKKLKETGLKIKILSGNEEALYSYYGMQLGFTKINGIIGDIGGGSLELALKTKEKNIKVSSMSTGILVLSNEFSDNLDKIYKSIQKGLIQNGWENQAKAKSFYATGGGWRSIARVGIEIYNYPIPIIHQYYLKIKTLKNLISLIIETSEKDLALLKSIPKDRIPFLKISAKSLEAVVDTIGAKDIYFSSYGLREGLLSKFFINEKYKLNSTFSNIGFYFNSQTDRAGSNNKSLTNWAKKFSITENIDLKLLNIVASLSNISEKEHPEFKAQNAFFKITRKTLLPFDHVTRAKVAIATYLIYNKNLRSTKVRKIIKFLSDAEFEESLILGNLIRLGITISGGATNLLKQSKIDILDNTIILEIPNFLLNRNINLRLSDLARIKSYQSKIITSH